MKVIVVISALAVAAGIRVPVWPESAPETFGVRVLKPRHPNPKKQTFLEPCDNFPTDVENKNYNLAPDSNFAANSYSEPKKTTRRPNIAPKHEQRPEVFENGRQKFSKNYKLAPDNNFAANRYSEPKKTTRRPNNGPKHEQRPEVFENGRQKFLDQQEKFRQKSAQYEEEEDSSEEEFEEEEFVPTRMLAQVRRTESAGRYPQDKDEPRLREVVRDSKSHIVYTEEGMEDSGYDHADHEKNAESEESFEEFDRGRNRKIRRRPVAKDSEAEGSVLGLMKLPKPKLAKRKQVKTTSIHDGKMKLEILSEVKILTDPNNVSKAHKFVKIAPTYQELVHPRAKRSKRFTNDFLGVQNNTQLPPQATTETSQRSKRLTNDILGVQINTDFSGVQNNTVLSPQANDFLGVQNNTELPPLPLQATTETSQRLKRLPNDISGVQINTELSPQANDFLRVQNNTELPPLPPQATTETSQRLKRFTNDFSGVQINTDFLGVQNNTELPSLPPQATTETKYPYYKSKRLHRNSPLRYGEDLKNVPDKSSGRMAFYEQMQKKTECAEETVDPVPERAKKSGSDQKGEFVEGGGSPRLGRLGDKIDCLKTRYFGEDPFDSPIFREEAIEPPSPIFRALDNEIKANRYLTRTGKVAEVNFADEPEAAPLRKVAEVNFTEGNDEPEAAPLRRRRKKRPQRPQSYKVFNMDRFVPPGVMSTILPKSQILSEVYYKDDIKPNEQLNVFADVINNIKNSSENEDVEVPFGDAVQSGSENDYATTKRSRNKTKNRRKPSNHKGTTERVEETSSVDYNEEPMVVGLRPPGHWQYSTIYKMRKEPATEIPMNLFYVKGMRPPAKGKPSSYSDYPNRVRRRGYRVRRSPNRPGLGYSEIRRDNQPPVEEEDDYVPNRRRNFHYDPEKRRIVYDKVEIREEENEEENEEEKEEEVVLIPTQREEPTTPSGPFFLDFVSKLKSHENYQAISETSKRTEPPPTTPRVVVNLPTTPPQFLSLISKLKNDQNYQPIPEKKIAPTTQTPIEEVEETKLEELKEVQNSPRGSYNKFDTKLEIFDISEYLPKPKNYFPATSIDTSKYKTIQRAPRPPSKEVGDRDFAESQEVTTVQPTTKSSRVRGRSRTTTQPPKEETTTKRPRFRARLKTTTTTETTTRSRRTHQSTKREIDLKNQTKTNLTSEVKRLPVEAFKKFDRDRKHGGNYKIDDKKAYVPPTAYELEDSEEIKRLTDVVPKPFAFYSDPKLPSSVNTLKVLEEGSELQDFEDGTDGSPEDYYEDGKTSENVAKVVQPVFIKDPSKRLYFYAPL